MKLNRIKIIISVLISVIISSCSTELDINAEWDDIPVIFCVLDHSRDFQYVKVNKTFLGNAPASEMAQESDSLFFDNVKVFLYEYAGNNLFQPINKIEFVEVDTIDKEEGYFANDKNMIYVSDYKLNKDNYYELEVRIDDDRKIVKSDATGLISDARIHFPHVHLPFINLANYGATTRYIFHPGVNAKVSQMTIFFNYIDVNTITKDTIFNTIEWKQPNVVIQNVSDNSSIERNIEIRGFYNILATRIPPLPENTIRYVKMPNSLEYRVSSADQNYRTYMEITAPSHGIVQEKPSYSNLENAIGLFAARYNTKISKKLGVVTLDSISRGIYTKDMGFQERHSQYYSVHF